MWRNAAASSGALKMCRALDDGEHVMCRFNGEPVRRKSWPRRYVSRHFLHKFGLAFRGLGQQRNDEVFEGDQGTRILPFPASPILPATVAAWFRCELDGLRTLQCGPLPTSLAG